MGVYSARKISFSAFLKNKGSVVVYMYLLYVSEAFTALWFEQKSSAKHFFRKCSDVITRESCVNRFSFMNIGFGGWINELGSLYSRTGCLVQPVLCK